MKKILFFSTNSNFYKKDSTSIKCFPNCKNQWKQFSKKYSEFDFLVMIQKPGMFILDREDLNSAETKIKISENLEISFFNEEEFLPEQIAQKIIEKNPDTVCPITYWINPFDWLSIKDSIICEIISKNGIKTISHSAKSSLICFDKIKTHEFLIQNNFLCAKGIEIHHEMFYAERSRLEIKENVYKEYVFSEIQKLNFPVVVKDTLGLSSFGMDVCKTFAETKHVLLSKKNNGDRLVEEFIDGLSFGVEIYGSDGDYLISPMFINSLNQFGLTSPKQNVKIGPVKNQNFKISELHNELKRLAKLLNFCGIVQVDLILKNEKWYIIEINSRLSGMSQTISSSLGLSLYELIFMATVDFNNSKEKLNSLIKNAKFTINLKFPILTDEKLKTLCNYDFVDFVNQIENHQAKQLREIGYSEVIFGKTSSKENLLQYLEILNSDFKEDMEERFYNNAKKLSELL